MVPSRRRVNNPLALAVLSCLAEKPRHPYEISTTLRTRNKEASIRLNYGSLYSVVESLEKHGLIRAVETSREGRRPERTVYEITEPGRHEFEDWLAELLSMPAHDYMSLEAGLSLMPGLPPDEVVRLLDDRAERLRAELRGMEAQGDQVGCLPEIFVVESQYRHAIVSAELQFVTTLAQRIRTGELGGTAMWKRIYELRRKGVGFEEMFADPVGSFGEEGRFFEQLRRGEQ
jgi:DNA-binding PadR family transcriptional regulator